MARPSNYTPEFRRRAIEEVLDRDRTVTEVARALSITTPETLRRWVVQARIDRGLVVAPTNEELAESSCVALRSASGNHLIGRVRRAS